MISRVSMLFLAVPVILSMLAGCGGTSGEDYAPVIKPANFVAVIDNPYFPLKPGTTFISEGREGRASARNEVNVTHETKTIMGVRCVSVRDRVWLNGSLVEDTVDWYAQDKDGNVWYFGEGVNVYKNGKVVSTSGSWEAGVDGARPGIIMQRKPAPNGSYRQEYYQGRAEDMAQVVSATESVSVPYGSFKNVVKTKEWSPLEPNVVEYKFYASGVGWIQTTSPGQVDEVKLVKITTG